MAVPKGNSVYRYYLFLKECNIFYFMLYRLTISGISKKQKVAQRRGEFMMRRSPIYTIRESKFGPKPIQSKELQTVRNFGGIKKDPIQCY